MNKSDEEKCLRCGRCCYRKLWIGDTIYYTPFPCEYLDTETKLCTIYEKRHEINPECLSVEEGIRLGIFPADCPYVRDIPDYKPPVTDLIDEEVVSLIENGEIEDEKDLMEIALRRLHKDKSKKV